MTLYTLPRPCASRLFYSLSLYFQEVFTLIAEIISVGTELLLGEIIDSNAAFVAQQLKDRGVRIYHKQTIGDNLSRLSAALHYALQRADLVIVGGGLGPTDDDLTREAIADALGETPEIDPQQLQILEAKYQARGRQMAASNIKQTWLIPSAVALDNPIGTAPGWLVTRPHPSGIGRQYIVALPGPPSEMQLMWHQQVVPSLPWPQTALFHRTFHTLGIGESDLVERLPAGITLKANPSVATYARKHGVDVRVAAAAPTLEAALALAEPALVSVEHHLAAYIYGQDQQTLADALEAQLKRLNATLGCLEGASIGSLAVLCSSVSRFTGSIVSAQTSVWTEFGLSAPCQDPAQALVLAREVRRHWGSQWGIVTSLPDQDACHIAISGPNHAHDQSWTLKRFGSPNEFPERIAQSALMKLYQYLCTLED